MNVGLTLRNWAICLCISYYELKGEDRATYGEHPRQCQVKGCDRRQLYRYREFFKCYPQVVGTVSPQWAVPAEMLVARLSYTHFEWLLALGDPLQRAFYEAECLRVGWFACELKRQIGSVSYERTALSRDKEALRQPVKSLAETDHPELILRDPVVFEWYLPITRY